MSVEKPTPRPIRLKSQDGGPVSIKMDPNGTLSSNQPLLAENVNVKAIGVRNIQDIWAHSVERTKEGTFHKIAFLNGSVFEVTFFDSGKFASNSIGDGISTNFQGETMMVGQAG